MMELKVDLGERSYPIMIGQGLLAQPERLVPFLKGHQVMIVTNTRVAPLYLQKVHSLCQDFKVCSVILEDGEQYKTLEACQQIWTALLENRFDRTCTLIALGGGVVGDITGYAAASYQRGVNFIQIPTTLLSQVDSSVGGKTGVNHPLGKNMIGAFHQPQAVLADTDTLNTLEDQHLSAGLAEVIKYGLIRDKAFLDWLEEKMALLLARDPSTLAEAIRRSCQNKAEVVSRDEKESGERALLNLGHTFGHAIEAGMGYGAWLHGEAISVGMMMAGDLSLRKGWLDFAQLSRMRELFIAARLPVTGPASMGKSDYHQLMAVDKKVQGGQLRLVLLKQLGHAVLTQDFTLEELDETLTAYTQN
jgi:3-dehydroquinate synthase